MLNLFYTSFISLLFFNAQNQSVGVLSIGHHKKGQNRLQL